MKTTKDCPVCGIEFTRVHTADKPPRYCSRACANKAPGRMTDDVRERIGAAMRAELHPRWAGGRWTGVNGRVYVHVPYDERHLHPTIRPDGYIRRYHYVWNKAHPDDPVRQGEVIHHLNEDPTDDRLENLEKTVQSVHARDHGTGRNHRPESRELMVERQKARRARERVERPEGWKTEACGTERGYFRHYMAGERACRPCLDAHSEYTRQTKARLRSQVD